MNDLLSPQTELFRLVRERTPASDSVVHEISELLHISYDSAYRRMRCEKELSLEEFRTLCLQYGISADLLFNLKTNNILFRSRAIGEGGYTLEQWLQAIFTEIKAIQAGHEREIVYSAKDLPIFYYFEFPELAAFKAYFWHKALFPVGGYEEKQFSFALDESFITLGKQLLTAYIAIPATELWNDETITSFIRQVEYCYLCGYFETKEDALRVCDSLENYIRHIRQQAERGYRFLYGTEPRGVEGSFRLFHNEVLLSDNTILVSVDGKRVTYHTYNIINLLITTNEMFCEQISNSLKILMQKSSLISGTSAKERNRFFNHLFERLKALKSRIELG